LVWKRLPALLVVSPLAQGLQSFGSYPFNSAALQPLTGKIYTRINSKVCLTCARRENPFYIFEINHFNSQVVFIVCLVVFEAGSALCGAAPSSTALIIGRALAGMGGAGLLNGSLIILNSCVPPSRQPGMPSILSVTSFETAVLLTSSFSDRRYFDGK
jgi:MFS family permease